MNMNMKNALITLVSTIFMLFGCGLIVLLRTPEKQKEPVRIEY